MKIVKFGGKSLANGEGINTVNIIEGKIKQEKNRYRGFRRGSWTIFLLLQPKWKLQTTFREFKT
jgi:hypothetical protein